MLLFCRAGCRNVAELKQAHEWLRTSVELLPCWLKGPEISARVRWAVSLTVRCTHARFYLHECVVWVSRVSLSARRWMRFGSTPRARGDCSANGTPCDGAGTATYGIIVLAAAPPPTAWPSVSELC